MDHGIDQDLLVPLGDLGDVAKVHVRNAPVTHGEDVPRVWIPVEQAEFQQLAEAGHHPHADEPVDVHPSVPDGLGVGAGHAVDPLQHDHPGPGEVLPYPGDLYVGVVLEVLPKHLNAAGLQVIIQLLQHLLCKLIHNQLRTGPQALLGDWVDELRKGAEDVQVLLDDGRDVRPLDLDGNVLPGGELGLVDLPQGSRCHWLRRDVGEDGVNRQP
mmetsp:Transcript_5494/g.9783  ORF Transcript_5494/g.9783 Transcript_5494/m.9783 type:complete len:213 (+) Transcript_5494:460-1098(+)